MTKTEQIENFLKKFKLIVNPSDEPREDVANDYDVVVLFDGKKVCDTKWVGGAYWVANKVHGTDIVQSVFQDAESYCQCLGQADGDETDAVAEFLDEFGYTEDSKALKKGFKAFKGCKRTYDLVSGIVLNNCAWYDGEKDAGMDDYLIDICNYFDEDCANNDLVEIDWDSYVEDYK